MAPPNNIPSPVAWLLSWLTATATALFLVTLIKVVGDLTWSDKRQGFDWTLDHFVLRLPGIADYFTLEMAAIPSLAAIWALLSSGLSRLLGRFSLRMVVALGAIVPILILSLVEGAPLRWEMLVAIGFFAFIGGASAYVGIRAARAIGHRESK